ERAARRIEHDREIGPLRDRRRRARSHGSRLVADPKRQSATRIAHCEISDRRLAAITIRLCIDRSLDPLRSDCPTIRDLGARPTQTWILIGRRRESRRREQANARAPYAERSRKITALLFSEPARRTRRAS